jgi:EpsI family protein
VGEILKSRTLIVLSVILIAQAVAYHAYPKVEAVPLARPLSEVPKLIGTWQMVNESELDSEVQELLKADDSLNRVYADGLSGRSASFYVAYFKTQRTGVSPHSPKVCLPGSGWVPSESVRVSIDVPGWEGPITVNRYIVAKGDLRSVVFYWYQTHNRVIASEYAAKLYTVADGLRYRRSDTSLVRVIVPFSGPDDTGAEAAAIGFVKTVFGTLREFLPK